MARFTDMQLLNMVYNYCVETETHEDYKQKLKKLEEETHKTVKYLEDLLRVYEDKLNPQQLATLKQAKKRHQESKMTYKKYVEKVLEMTEKELIELITITSPSDMKDFFERYIKNTKDLELAKKVKELFEKIKQIYEDIKENKKSSKKQDTLEEARKILKTMRNRGYFSYIQFRKDYCKEQKISESDAEKLLKKAKMLLQKYLPEELEDHKRIIEENRIKTFKQKEEQIRKMLQLLPDNYDIVDYYLNIGMDIYVFLKLCEGLITPEEKTKINVFFFKYIDIQSWKEKFPTWIRITKDTVINNEILTVELQDTLLEQMNKKGIPTNYFMWYLNKYRKNTLNIEQKTKK